MEIAEILLHLLGGGGMEYAARSRFSQQAEEQAEQNALARAQERMLQSTDIGAAASENRLGRTHTTGERVGAQTHDTTERGLERTSTETMHGQDITSREKTIDWQIEGSKAVAYISKAASDYGVDKNDDFERWRENIQGALMLGQLEMGWAGLTGKVAGGTISAMIDKNASRFKAALQAQGASPKESNAIVKESSKAIKYVFEGRDLDFSSPVGKEIADLEATFRAEYQDALGRGTPPAQALEDMLIGLYNELQARGLGKSEYAARLYKLSFDKPIEEGAEEYKGAVGKDDDGVGFWEGAQEGKFNYNRPLSRTLGLLGTPFLAASGGLRAMMGDTEGGAGDAGILWAIAQGYPPDTYIAAMMQEQREAREGGTRSVWDILREDYTRFEGNKRAGIPDPLDIPSTSIQTGAPGLE